MSDAPFVSDLLSRFGKNGIFRYLQTLDKDKLHRASQLLSDRTSDNDRLVKRQIDKVLNERANRGDSSCGRLDQAQQALNSLTATCDALGERVSRLERADGRVHEFSMEELRKRLPVLKQASELLRAKTRTTLEVNLLRYTESAIRSLEAELKAREGKE